MNLSARGSADAGRITGAGLTSTERPPHVVPVGNDTHNQLDHLIFRDGAESVAGLHETNVIVQVHSGRRASYPLTGLSSVMPEDDELQVDDLEAAKTLDKDTNAAALPAAADTEAPQPSRKVFVVGPATLIRAHRHEWADWREPAPLVPNAQGYNLIRVTDLNQLGPEWEFLDLGVNLHDYWRTGPQRAFLREHVQRRFGVDLG